MRSNNINVYLSMETKTTKLDLSGFTRDEVMTLCKINGLSKSTYYASLRRGWMIVETRLI